MDKICRAGVPLFLPEYPPSALFDLDDLDDCHRPGDSRNNFAPEANFSVEPHGSHGRTTPLLYDCVSREALRGNLLQGQNCSVNTGPVTIIQNQTNTMRMTANILGGIEAHRLGIFYPRTKIKERGALRLVADAPGAYNVPAHQPAE